MAKAYSMDLCDRAAAAIREGMSRHQAAARYSASVASVVRWCQLAYRMGSTKPGRLGGHRPWLLEGERDFIMGRIAEQPDLTPAALLVEAEARGTVVSLDTLWRFLKRCGHSFQKSILPAEQLRPDIARRRYWWKKYLPRFDISRFVSIDETWMKTNMTRRRSWCQKNQRLHTKLPHGHWKTLTFIAALRADGLTAPGVLDGPVNRLSFEAYFEQILGPTLRPRDIVIMDNLNSHKGEAVRRMIRQAGAHLLFLPAYSPDLNPIEQAFSKFKELMRKAVERTIDGLVANSGRYIKHVR